MSNFIRISKRFFIGGLVVAIIVIFSVIIGVTIHLVGLTTSDIGAIGLAAFKLFTVQSNILLAATSFLVIPYLIDGIRTITFRIPKWLIYALYVSISSVGITFLVALTIIAPTTGFTQTFFGASNFFLHLLSPVCAILMFLLVCTDYKIKLPYTFMAIIPGIFYGFLYIIMAFFVDGELGWDDFYRFDAYVPWPLTILIIACAALIVATILRLAHNATNKHNDELLNREFKILFDIYNNDIREVTRIFALTNNVRKHNAEDDIIVPVRVLKSFKDYSEEDVQLKELCNIYINAYSESMEHSN